MNMLSNDEIELRQIVDILSINKLLILTISISSFIFGIIYSLSIEDEYSSSSLLKVSEENQTSSSFLDQYSGIASLAGINIPSSRGTNPSITAIEKIKSRDFLKHLLTFEGIRENLLAAVAFDPVTNKIIYDEKLFNPESKKWVRSKSYASQSIIPSHLELYKKYRSIVKVSIDDETGFVNISVKHYSPIFAEQFLSLIIDQINETSRNDDLENTVKSLTFLEGKIKTTNINEIKETLNLLITEQLKKQMLTNVSKDYILEPIDNPYIPELKSSPNRMIISLLFLIFGLISSIIWVLVRFFYKS